MPAFALLVKESLSWLTKSSDDTSEHRIVLLEGLSHVQMKSCSNCG